MRTASTLILVLLTALVAFLSFQSIGQGVQLLTAVAILGLVFVLTRFEPKGLLRQIAMALAGIVVIRYVYWRTTETLPGFDDPISFFVGILLYAAEMFSIAMFIISAFVNADPIKRAKPAPVKDEDLPTVDVFVPSYNESADILGLTLAAANAMDYPRDKLNVYLLDDGGTDAKRNSEDPEQAEKANARARELKALCANIGVRYMTRAENEHAKAGNLNSGLQRTSGELVAVFDADHAPERSFLRETVGYFCQDPHLFLAQTPHFFSNPDPLERNLNTFNRMPSENEMFYSTIQRGLDRWNASFFCGSAALLRREALEEVGGFSGQTITEDCETALELHSRGWNSVYIDKPLITGLQPETFASFIGQRSRWCQGMVQIMLLKNPLFKSGLSFAQRISYVSSCFFWLFPFVRMTFLVTPALFILFNLKIFNASAEDFLAYTVTYLIASELLRNYLFGNVRWPWISELYEYVQSVFLFRAIISVVLNPRKPVFNVTDKGVALTHRHLSALAMPFFVIFLALAAVLYVAIYRYQTEPALGDLIIITGFWNLLNLVIASAALGIVTEQPSDVDGASLAVAEPATLEIGERMIPIRVRQASTAQAKVELLRGATSASLRQGDYARIHLNNPSEDLLIPSIPVFIGRPVDGAPNAITLSLDADAQHYAAIADLMLRDMSIPRQLRGERQRRQFYLFSVLTLLKWSIISPFSAIGAAFAQKPRAERIARTRRPAVEGTSPAGKAFQP